LLEKQEESLAKVNLNISAPKLEKRENTSQSNKNQSTQPLAIPKMMMVVSMTMRMALMKSSMKTLCEK
jgi:hypothetical protein